MAVIVNLANKVTHDERDFITPNNQTVFPKQAPQHLARVFYFLNDYHYKPTLI
jgi:hypothetical protein